MNANHISSGKSATIHQLPTASAFPVVQPARRGKLPSHINSIPAMLIQRGQEGKALIDKRQAAMKRLCFKILTNIDRGEITGLAIIETCVHGPDRAHSAGELEEDLGYLASCIDAFAELAEDMIASRENGC